VLLSTEELSTMLLKVEEIRKFCYVLFETCIIKTFAAPEYVRNVSQRAIQKNFF
jgi:hypothetical protein